MYEPLVEEFDEAKYFEKEFDKKLFMKARGKRR